MKKIAQVLLTVMIMATAASAQTDKGDWLVGGNLTIGTATGASQFTVQPMGGYFFAKPLDVILRVVVLDAEQDEQARTHARFFNALDGDRCL